MFLKKDSPYAGHILCGGGENWSVINGFGTYGGFGLLGEKNKGLLELWAEQVNDGTPLGNLTADDVINLMEKA